jgi:hypothetical protein
MSDNLLRAFHRDTLAIEASLPVLKMAVDAIKAWHCQVGFLACGRTLIALTINFCWSPHCRASSRRRIG